MITRLLHPFLTISDRNSEVTRTVTIENSWIEVGLKILPRFTFGDRNTFPDENCPFAGELSQDHFKKVERFANK